MKKTKSMKLISLLLSMMMVLSLFSVMGTITASAAFGYSSLDPGTLFLVGDQFYFDKVGSFKFADYDDPSVIHEVKGSDFEYNQVTLSTTDGYYSFGSTKCLPVSVSPGGLLVSDYDATTNMVTFGVQNITYEFDESTGTLSVGGTGVVPRYLAMTGDNYGVVGFTQSNLVKHMIIDANNISRIKWNAFMAYTEGCVLEDVVITSNSSTPLAIEKEAFFYMKDGPVTITVNAKKLADVTVCPVGNYGSPVNLIYNVQQPITFKKNALAGLYGDLTVTFPTGCVANIPPTPQFVDSSLQSEYDHLAKHGDEGIFWDIHSNLVEGTDYVVGEAHDEELAPRNASLVVGDRNTAIFAEVASTGVTLDKSAITIDADGTPVKLTATVTPVAATHWKPKWSVTGSSNVKLYVDSECNSELGADEVAEVVYVKGTADDIATVTATTVDTNKSASCTVNHTHDWNEPSYTWSDDNLTCTAKRVCAEDDTHIETETVTATSAVEKDATCEEKGDTTYTAKFENPAFKTQTKTVTDIEKLGHRFINFLKWVWDGFNKAVAWLFCDNDPDHIETIDVPSAVDTVDTPDCTHEGYIYHVATIDVAGRTYTTVNVETLDQLGHDWSPVYVWDYDGVDDGVTVPDYYLEVTLICNNDEDHKLPLDVKMERKDNDDGSVTFIGHCEYDGVDYTDSITVKVEPATPDVPTPDVPTPDVPTPDVPTPDVPTPDVPTPDVPTPDVPTPDVPTPDVPTPDVPTPDVPTPDVPTPDVPTPDVPEKELKGILGDVNNDGVVDSADALLILRNSVDMQDFTDLQKFLGDVDFDGENITSADALAVLRYSIGMSENDKIGTEVSKTIAA